MKNLGFRKYHGDGVAADWQRVLVMQEICDQVNGVTTAKPYSLDLANKSIVYQRIDFPAPLIRFVGDTCVFEELARLLVHMHRTPFMPTAWRGSAEPCPLPELGVSADDVAMLHRSMPPGWIHADFWHGNVFHKPAGGFVVVDPVPARFTPFTSYLFGCGALDVASMYMGLLLCHPLHRQLRLDVSRYLRAGEAFLHAYLEEVDASSPEMLGAVRKLSRILALRFIDGYSQRLTPALVWAKRHAAERIVRRVDRMIDWGIG